MTCTMGPYPLMLNPVVTYVVGSGGNRNNLRSSGSPCESEVLDHVTYSVVEKPVGVSLSLSEQHKVRDVLSSGLGV